MTDGWNEYMGADERPRQFDLAKSDTEANTWTFFVKTHVPMPVRLSTLFGEWLYQLRAALDGFVFYLGVRDSGQNPPPAERSLQFPVMLDSVKYDGTDHRGKLQALSDTTFGHLRYVQPFNAHPDHRANVLWWLEELARIDRHRRGHALAPHIVKSRIGLKPPLRLISQHLPQLATQRVPIDEWAPMPIIDFEAPADWEVFQVREHMDISDALTNEIDVTEWAAGAAPPMSTVDLGRRMTICESFVLNGLIDPVATGNINPQ
ncbi:hypothetical protein [Mycobacterium sp. M23085]|uniref:hypothetical protein n=1 Tax=Mycobacterium sp. M23085 TaxID=3378087 RepID=UPI003877DB5E